MQDRSQRSWLNQPAVWQDEGNAITLVTEQATDFWCQTFYGFVRDSGHFYHEPVSGDFSAEVRVSADYTTLYDQAGLMLRVDPGNWLKTGIEYTDGAMHFSVVVTRERYSDWSVIELPMSVGDGIDIRLTRHGEAVRVQFRLLQQPWRMARLAMLAMPEKVAVGVMACTPERAGLKVRFDGLRIGPAIARSLHDDT
jgi:regulation of enolase protein 1 (concanavalin A-like superfamily)